MSLKTIDFKTYDKGDRPSAKDFNNRGDMLSKILRSLGMNGIADSTGLLTRQPNTTKSTLKLFEVQSAAAGDGVYNCFEQILDATEWADTAGDSKIDDKDAISIEVLNLAEFDPEATYVAHLAAGDLIVAWKKTDDEANTRWIGLPLRQANADRSRIAYCKTDAGAAASIVCFLDTDTTGTEITVNCNITGGGNLNACLRRLEDGDRLIVTKVGGGWYCTEGFQTSEDCVCEEP